MEELMILPTGAKSFREALQIGSEIYHTLKMIIKEKYGPDAANVCDMGGFSPKIRYCCEGLELLQESIKKAGYMGWVHIGIDIAASMFHKENKNNLDFKNPELKSSDWLTGPQLTELYHSLISKFPIVSIEDCFDQEDWAAWSELTAGTTIQIVGDKLLATSPIRIKKAIENKACNALLLKINPIGSVTEAIEACTLAQGAGWGVMVSHRSAETEDTFIADLSVGLCAGQIKAGGPCRSERVAKYNQLLRIEEELGEKAKFKVSTIHMSTEP